MTRYKIIRFYCASHKKRILQTGLTLEQVQQHCSNPETSWMTCRKPYNKQRTKKLGPWFDGYTVES